jgi:hypothetical protein
MNTNETKFTLGPWRTVEHSWQCTGIFSGERHVASVEIDGDVTEDNQDKFEATMNADARLIAAAPELYAALVEAIAELNAYCEEIDGEGYNNPNFNAILAKARGEAL